MDSERDEQYAIGIQTMNTCSEILGFLCIVSVKKLWAKFSFHGRGTPKY